MFVSPAPFNSILPDHNDWFSDSSADQAICAVPTIEECMQLCVDEAECKSLDFVYHGGDLDTACVCCTADTECLLSKSTYASSQANWAQATWASNTHMGVYKQIDRTKSITRTDGSTMCQAGAINTLTSSGPYEIIHPTAKVDDATINALFNIGDTKEVLFAHHGGQNDWSWGTCVRGLGEENRAFSTVDKPSEALCKEHCAAEPNCKGIDFTTTSTGKSCRLYPYGSVARIGVEFADESVPVPGDIVPRMYCEKVGSKFESAPQQFDSPWSKKCALSLSNAFTWSSAVGGGTLPDASSDFVARHDGTFMNCFDGKARTLGTTISTDTCGLGFTSSFASFEKISIGCNAETFPEYYCSKVYDNSHLGIPFRRDRYNSYQTALYQWSVHGVAEVTSSAFRDTGRHGWR